MRILIDLQGAQNESRDRGIGRYILALCKAITRNRGEHEVFILLNDLFPTTIKEIQNQFHGILSEENFVIFSAAGPVDELSGKNTWRVRVAEFLREKFVNDIKPDVILIGSLFEGGCDNTIVSVGKLFSNIKTAVILYDLIPLIDPAKYLGWEPAKDWYQRKIESLKRADQLLAISTSAQQEAVDYLSFDLARTTNISSAADHTFTKSNLSKSAKNKIFDRYKIRRSFFLHSSAFDERKNFHGLICAFGLLPKILRETFQLVLVCKINDENRKSLLSLAASVGLKKDDVILTGFIPDNDLIALYSECYLFVFPSFHEGFGLPALEAMSCGAATIGSNISSIPEVIGRQDALFDPKSNSNIAAMLERSIIDKIYWSDLKAHAIIQAKKFNWDTTAINAIHALEKLALNACIHEQENSKQNRFEELIANIRNIDTDIQPQEVDLISTATAIAKNELAASNIAALGSFNGALKWRIEGPFDSTYSLALLNRETARAVEKLGHVAILHSTEGPGDFEASPEFLTANPDIALMHSRVERHAQELVDISSRNLYPPRVRDMASPFNLMHHYAWEESGFPQEWVNGFNESLQGITCLSKHVEKILIDNGVSVKMSTSGCGVDHWERIDPDPNYRINARAFRFLHVSSCFPRKGVDRLLEAYGKAFSIRDDITLVIKTFDNPHNEINQWIENCKQSNNQFPHVIVISGDLKDNELKALYQQCDVLVAPSKAEGFGLPMAEGMLSGLPVITTGWGGQLDFCDEDNSWIVDYDFEKAETHFGLFASAWASIKVNDLADALTNAKSLSKVELVAKATSGRVKLLEHFKWEDVLARAIDSICDWKFNSSEEPDVQIGWITTWNTKCGIATYSEQLISNIADNVTVLAPYQSELVRPDKSNCIRCWELGKNENNFHTANNYILKNNLNTIVIQFNYGFFNHRDLDEFIEEQLISDRIVIVMMHSTVDPPNTPEWNFKLREIAKILSKCNRILVHSISDLNRLKNIGLVDNVALFPHGVMKYSNEITKSIKSDIPIIASYGFCLPHKGLLELVEAISILKKQGQWVKLRLVNAEYPAYESASLVSQLKALILKLDVEDLVTLCTDFLEDSESLFQLSEADLLVFAYQGTGESSSAAVRYGLATKQPVAVTPLSIFDDVGDSVFRFDGVSPVEISKGITECLFNLSSNSPRAIKIAQVANQWRDQHNFTGVSKRIFNISKALLRARRLEMYVFHGSSPLLKTVVGKIEGKKLSTTGNFGNLVHGPYLSVGPGIYDIVISGSIGPGGVAGAKVDIAVDHGARILYESSLSEPDGCGKFISVRIIIDSRCHNLEFRVWVSEYTDICISSIMMKRSVKPLNQINKLPEIRSKSTESI